MKTQNPGCLTALLNLFQKKKEIEDLENLPYRKRDDFLSDAETSFFHVLKSITGNHLVIFSKISFSDIFFVVNRKENMAYYNKISQKHVDFLICNPKTLAPMFAIELDDTSHSKHRRIERDEFVDKVFETANLPLLHIPVQVSYNTEELEGIFRKTIQRSSTDETAQKPSSQKPESTGPPLCPKCEVHMIKRIAKSGPHAGIRFYGCPNYPKCKEINLVSEED